ncbi:MAG: PEP-CTERM sorting domain-containing protein [Syntrophotaleaceae bacterium]
MKKFLSLIAIAAMALVFTAGSALADFASGQLIRVIYQDNGDVEMATSLGSVADLLGTNNNTVGSSVSLSSFAGADYSNLNVAYLVYGGGANTTHYFSGETDVVPMTGSRNGSSLNTNLNTVVSYYSTLGTDSATASQGSVLSFAYRFGTDGLLADFYTRGNAIANLADLATAGYVDQTLYSFATPNAAAAGVAVATLRTALVNGVMVTTVNPSAVPVPASLLLFGSGLLGLVGVRRKTA